MHRTMATRAAYDFLCDSHCHIREAVAGEVKARVADAPSSTTENEWPTVASLVLCGTHPQIDWVTVEQAVTETLPLKPLLGFGVHPWFVPTSCTQQTASGDGAAAESAAGVVSPTDGLAEAEGNRSGCCGNGGASSHPPLTLSLSEIVADLEGRLSRHPRAIVAEIGLDKLRGPSEAVQAEAFLAQLRLAAKHQRPVSVHCVRHYGLLLQLLQELAAEDTPPAIVVHAFTGSLEIAKSLLNLKNKKRTVPVGHSQEESDAAAAPVQEQQKKKTKRGGASADAVCIKKRIFFGIGLSTSFTVKNFSATTLPLLLASQRVLLETDAHYSAEAGWGSMEDLAGCEAQSCMYVKAQEHAGQLRDVLRAVETAAKHSAEFTKLAQEAGVEADVFARDAIAAAYKNAFRSVLE